MKKNNYNFVLRILSSRGCRIEYSVVLLINDDKEIMLPGKVVRSKSKGKTTWKTSCRGKSVDLYNPEWLMRRNSRSVTLGLDHPAMYQVKARHDVQMAEAEAKKLIAKAKREAKKQAKMLDPVLGLMLDSNVKLAS